MPQVVAKPGSPICDTRVFGVSRGSKSPLRPNGTLSRENSVSPVPPVASIGQPTPVAAPRVSQSLSTTPATNSKEFAFFDNNDFNNNPMNGDRKIFGLPSRGGSKNISPLGNHGVQSAANEQRKIFFGVNPKQRHNSFSCDRDWKSSLPIIHIPNTDQLLPSQTKQMQTYINQTPPTEKNLRPSLIGLERRRIRPVWPPPHPGRVHRTGVHAEGRGKGKSHLIVLK